MSRLFYHVMQDNAGNLLFDVLGTMRLAGTGTLATIYGDEALTVIVPNPMTNHASFGSFKCFLGAGDYDFYMAKSGYSFETLTGVQGHGTMAQQDANAVAITGGSAQLTGDFIVDTSTLMVNATAHGVGVGTHGASGAKFTVGGTTYLNGHVGVTTLSDVVNRIRLQMVAGTNGIGYVPSGSGGLAWTPAKFYNVGSGEVGSITSNDTATFYNTSSDARLKHAIATLTGALDRIRALNPVSFLWNADGSPGEGFLAHELMREVPLAVTGTPDAVDEAGNIQLQGVDHSKLVVWLVGACQELAARVEALEARLAP